MEGLTKIIYDNGLKKYFNNFKNFLRFFYNPKTYVPNNSKNIIEIYNPHYRDIVYNKKIINKQKVI